MVEIEGMETSGFHVIAVKSGYGSTAISLRTQYDLRNLNSELKTLLLLTKEGRLFFKKLISDSGFLVLICGQVFLLAFILCC